MSKHLDLVTRVPCHADHFVIAGDRLYGSARYGDHNAATIIDLADITAPRVLATLPCKRQTPSIAVVGDVMFVGEYKRSILVVDVSDPTRPTPFNAVVEFRRELSHFRLAEGLLVAAAGDDGVFALDVRDPRRVKPLPLLALAGDEPHVEHLAQRDGTLYAALRKAGCAILELGDGTVRERGRIAPEGFRVERVLATAQCLWLFGSGEDDDARLVVVDRATGAERYRGKCHISEPHTLIEIAGGGIGFHQHYTASRFDDAAARITRVFQQFEDDETDAYIEIPMVPREADDDENDDAGDDEDGDDEGGDGLVPSYAGLEQRGRRSCFDTVEWVVRRGDYLVAAHGKELCIWKPRPGSVFG